MTGWNNPDTVGSEIYLTPHYMRMVHIALAVTVVTINPTPALREIGANYFEALDQSQVWLNLDPQGTEAGPNPLRLNITATFPGRRMVQPPKSVTVRVQADCFAFPTRIRRPILRVIVGGTTDIDLTAPGKVFQFVSSCSADVADTITAPVSFDVLHDISNAHDVQLIALGFSARLLHTDLHALQRFVRLIAGGVLVK